MTSKILLLGAGGVGSWVADFLTRALANGEFDASLTVWDFDNIEEKNLLYSDYNVSEVGASKASAIQHRLAMDIRSINKAEDPEHKLTPIPVLHEVKKFESPYDLEGFDIVIVTTDEFVTRQIVHENCEHWVDARAEGQNFQIFTQDCPFTDKFTTSSEPLSERASCQLDPWTRVDLANVVCAGYVTQMVLAMLRGEKYSTHIFGRVE